MKRSTATRLSLIALSVALGACGGRTMPGGGNDNNSNQQNNNNVSPGGECLNAQDCVIARKWDACCSCAVPASAEDLAADPCLIPLEQSAIPEQCFVECPAIECPPCPDDGKSLDCQAGECTWKEGHCLQDTECVPAIRVDNCCQQAFPATHADVAADPCLVYWPTWWTGIPAECMERWPEWCALVDCAERPPPSRAMYCSSDGCAYAEECQDVGDCTLMVDHRQCCSCPEVWPASMIGHHPCVLPVGQTPPPDCYPEACLGVMCEECGPAPQQDCAPGGLCTGLYWEAQ